MLGALAVRPASNIQFLGEPAMSNLLDKLPTPNYNRSQETLSSVKAYGRSKGRQDDASSVSHHH